MIYFITLTIVLQCQSIGPSSCYKIMFKIHNNARNSDSKIVGFCYYFTGSNMDCVASEVIIPHNV